MNRRRLAFIRLYARSRNLESMNYTYPSDTESVIKHLLLDLGKVFERIAPEHGRDLDLRTRDVTMAVVDSPVFRCEATAGYKLIVLSTRTIELTWAFSYAWWVFYQTVPMGTKADGKVHDMPAHPVLANALRLLDWAVKERSGGAGEAWPENLPMPSARRRFGSSEHVADEMTLVGAAFMVLHELAHTYLDPGVDDLMHERECDQEAARWMLGDEDVPSDQRRKRALGLAVALLLIATKGIHTGDHDGRVHPLDFDRLVDTLKAHVKADADDVWGFVVGIMSLHLTEVGLTPPRVEFENFYDCALAYRELLRHRLERMRRDEGDVTASLSRSEDEPPPLDTDR